MFTLKKFSLKSIIAILACIVLFGATSAYASLNGTYLVRNVDNNDCLSSVAGSVRFVTFRDCNTSDLTQRWQIEEIGQIGITGINILYLTDSTGTKWCLSSGGNETNGARAIIEKCVNGNMKQQWLTDGAINYGSKDSYRLHYRNNLNFCLDNGGTSGTPYLYQCLGSSDPNRSNQQWYFDKQ